MCLCVCLDIGDIAAVLYSHPVKAVNLVESLLPVDRVGVIVYETLESGT